MSLVESTLESAANPHGAAPSTPSGSSATPRRETETPRRGIESPGFRAASPIRDDDARFYREHGFLVVENAFNDNEVQRLHEETVAICRGDLGHYGGWLGPHDGQTPDEIIRQYLCVHFPHKIGAACRASLDHPAIVDALTRLIGPNVKCMQSMLFIKAAGKPGQAWHQDEIYIPTRDRSLCGGWIALDDATVENGCLWVIPGSHRPGILWPQRSHDDRRFDCAGESHGHDFTDDDAVPVEVKRGAVVFFNGYLLHRSLPNRAASGFRRALVNHYMSAESLLPWLHPGDNYAMAQHDYRDIVLVAGKDPYAYKGIVDIARPGVRPSGEGGCAQWGKKEIEKDTDDGKEK